MNYNTIYPLPVITYYKKSNKLDTIKVPIDTGLDLTGTVTFTFSIREISRDIQVVTTFSGDPIINDVVSLPEGILNSLEYSNYELFIIYTDIQGNSSSMLYRLKIKDL